MPIQGTNPVTINTSYQNYWMPSFRINAPYPNGLVTVDAVLRPYTTETVTNTTTVPVLDANGQPVLDANGNPETTTTTTTSTTNSFVPGVSPVQYHLYDLFGAAANDAELANIVGLLMGKMQSLAQAASLI